MDIKVLGKTICGLAELPDPCAFSGWSTPLSDSLGVDADDTLLDELRSLPGPGLFFGRTLASDGGLIGDRSTPSALLLVVKKL